MSDQQQENEITTTQAAPAAPVASDQVAAPAQASAPETPTPATAEKAVPATGEEAAPAKPKRTRRTAKPATDGEEVTKPKRRTTRTTRAKRTVAADSSAPISDEVAQARALAQISEAQVVRARRRAAEREAAALTELAAPSVPETPAADQPTEKPAPRTRRRTAAKAEQVAEQVTPELTEASVRSAAGEGTSPVEPAAPVEASEVPVVDPALRPHRRGRKPKAFVEAEKAAAEAEPGEVVLNAKLLSSMVSRMPSGQINIQSAENGKTTIQSGVAQFEIQSMNPTDFPELPNTGAEETLNIKTGVLRDMIERTLYAVSQDEKKPAHTGELFEISPDKLTVVALDGYRLAIVERPVEAIKEIRIIVPSKTMNEVSHLLANDDEETVHISANRRYVVFTTAGYTIMSRLIEGEFLNYHNVIPNGSRTSVVLDTKEFIETIERASLIITERLKNPLRITFTEGKVVVRCQTNLGRVVDEFNAECEGDEVEIGFNNRYLLDALRNARTEKVRMEISGPLSPVKVLPVEGSDFLYLVLPVRFKND